MSASPRDGGEDRGFAGLTSLVTDLDELLTTSPVDSTRSTEGSEDRRVSSDEASVLPAPSQDSNSSKTSPHVLLGWLAVVLSFGLALALAPRDQPLSYEPPSAPNGDRAAPDVAPAPEATSSPVPEVDEVDPAPRPDPAPPPSATTPPFEEQLPPVGTDHVLSVAQIRYCLAEEIRIDAADPLVDVYVGSEVDRFNRMVDDFNSRCGEYQYWEGTLAQARTEVEAHREAIAAEGRRRFQDQS